MQLHNKKVTKKWQDKSYKDHLGDLKQALKHSSFICSSNENPKKKKKKKKKFFQRIHKPQFDQCYSNITCKMSYFMAPDKNLQFQKTSTPKQDSSNAAASHGSNTVKV